MFILSQFSWLRTQPAIYFKVVFIDTGQLSRKLHPKELQEQSEEIDLGIVNFHPTYLELAILISRVCSYTNRYENLIFFFFFFFFFVNKNLDISLIPTSTTSSLQISG